MLCELVVMLVNQERLDEFMTALIEEAQLSRLNEANITQAHSFLRRAQMDLVNSKDASRRSDWSEAVYKLQQAGEKGTKAYLLYTGFANHDELRKEVGHLSLRGFKLLLERSECVRRKTRLDELVKAIFPNAKTDTTKFFELAGKRPTQMMDIVNLDYSAIRKIMHDTDRELRHFDNLCRKVRGLVDDEFIGQFMVPIKRIRRFENAKAPTVDEVVGHMDTLLGRGYAHLGLLYIVSSISSPHEDFTRYPDDRGNGLSWDDYTKDLGIVRATPELRVRLEEALAFMDELWEMTQWYENKMDQNSETSVI